MIRIFCKSHFRLNYRHLISGIPSSVMEPNHVSGHFHLVQKHTRSKNSLISNSTPDHPNLYFLPILPSKLTKTPKARKVPESNSSHVCSLFHHLVSNSTTNRNHIRVHITYLLFAEFGFVARRSFWDDALGRSEETRANKIRFWDFVAHRTSSM